MVLAELNFPTRTREYGRQPRRCLRVVAVPAQRPHCRSATNTPKIQRIAGHTRRIPTQRTQALTRRATIRIQVQKRLHNEAPLGSFLYLEAGDKALTSAEIAALLPLLNSPSDGEILPDPKQVRAIKPHSTLRTLRAWTRATSQEQPALAEIIS
jgi:hypothetical protein